MFRSRKFMPLAALLAGAAVVFGSPSFVGAAFTLKVRVTDVDASLSTTVLDNSGLDSDSDQGYLTTTITVGDFKVTLTAVSKPFLYNDANHGELDIIALSIVKIKSGSGTVRVEATDIDFELAPDAGGKATLTSTIGGTGSVGSIVKSQVSVDYPGNSEFGASFTVSNTPPNLGPGGFSSERTGQFDYTGGKFSMSILDEITLPNDKASVSFDHDGFVETPVPAGILLAGIGGLSLAGFRLRRKKAIV